MLPDSENDLYFHPANLCLHLLADQPGGAPNKAAYNFHVEL